MVRRAILRDVMLNLVIALIVYLIDPLVFGIQPSAGILYASFLSLVLYDHVIMQYRLMQELQETNRKLDELSQAQERQK